ncbi:hypothetical protein PF002_g9458 [Phytophthora fragariae]|uniref:BED-type domain-containing protein n=1 Tax=Phytophthora fragariae TaxID=53985 RepID=A0A6A3ZTZ1_9STRA|nr:hypothetical protein PF003_g1962 [Phytophthora fragariae]KAE9241045.1 hypothetical protein PF002_g9458 [Phytophthora fragariae]KAE9322594.1 hypothetical protein PF001_g4320 [Phytophthora fragariae]
MTDNLLNATRPLASFTHRQIAGFFFKSCLDGESMATGYKACKACGKCRKHTNGTGYTNLVFHVRSCHPNFEMDMRNVDAGAKGTLVSSVSQNAPNLYSWLHWIFIPTFHYHSVVIIAFYVFNTWLTVIIVNGINVYKPTYCVGRHAPCQHG